MALADDLRATAVDHAAIAITQALAGGAGTDPERRATPTLDRAADILADAQARAAPIIVDAERQAEQITVRQGGEPNIFS